MRWLKDLAAAVFKPATIEDIVRQNLEKVSLESRQAEQVILHHQFAKHLADAQIAAITEWHQQHKTHELYGKVGRPS